MSKNERFVKAFYFLKSEGIFRTQKEAAKLMEGSAPNISSALAGNEKVLTDSFIIRFAKAFKQISLDWLLFEEGPMLTIQPEFRDENTPLVLEYEEDKDVIEEQKNMTARIMELVNDHGHIPKTFALKADIEVSLFQRKLKGLAFWSVADVHKICDTYRVRKGWIVDGDGQKYRLPEEVLETIPARSSTIKDSNTIPLIPMNAVAGKFNGNDNQIMPYDIESYFVVPTFRKSDFCIRVEGDSMEPTYRNGDIIACKNVPMTDIWFQWGKIYVISTDQGVLVKHIEQGSDERHVRLVSDNPSYHPFEIPVDGIYNMAIINGLIRVE